MPKKAILAGKCNYARGLLMSSLEKDAPESLKEVQKWFAGVITAPLINGEFIQKIAPSGRLIEEEAKDYILPNPLLQSFERIEIYNQQYWWRLIGVLQDFFPLVNRLYGNYLFSEELAIPYLYKSPLNHWSFEKIGEPFIEWLKNDYKTEEKELVLHAAALDLAFQKAFTANSSGEKEALSPEELLETPFTLDRSVSLFAFPYDLLPFRQEMLSKGSDEWINLDFPPLEKEKSFYIIYRNYWSNVSFKKMTEAEHEGLSFFKEKNTITAFCDALEEGSFKHNQEIEDNLELWIKEWIGFHFLEECV